MKLCILSIIGTELTLAEMKQRLQSEVTFSLLISYDIMLQTMWKIQINMKNIDRCVTNTTLDKLTLYLVNCLILHHSRRART